MDLLRPVLHFSAVMSRTLSFITQHFLFVFVSPILSVSAITFLQPSSWSPEAPSCSSSSLVSYFNCLQPRREQRQFCVPSPCQTGGPPISGGSSNQEMEMSLRCITSQKSTCWVEYTHYSLPVASTCFPPLRCIYGYQPPLFKMFEGEVSVLSAHVISILPAGIFEQPAFIQSQDIRGQQILIAPQLL